MSVPAVPAHLGEHLRSVVDAAYCLGQAVSRGDCRGRRRDRGRHERDGRVQTQERDAQQAGTDGGLNKCSLREAPAGINRRAHCDWSRRSDAPSGTTLSHEPPPCVRRRIEEMAALPAVSAATPPAIRPAFKSLLLFTPPLRAANESPTESRS